jgi:hypothetical protein
MQPRHVHSAFVSTVLVSDLRYPILASVKPGRCEARQFYAYDVGTPELMEAPRRCQSAGKGVNSRGPSF